MLLHSWAARSFQVSLRVPLHHYIHPSWTLDELLQATTHYCTPLKDLPWEVHPSPSHDSSTSTVSICIVTVYGIKLIGVILCSMANRTSTRIRNGSQRYPSTEYVQDDHTHLDSTNAHEVNAHNRRSHSSRSARIQAQGQAVTTQLCDEIARTASELNTSTGAGLIPAPALPGTHRAALHNLLPQQRY